MNKFEQLKKTDMPREYIDTMSKILPNEEELKNSWNYNVSSNLKHMTQDEIKKHLDKSKKSYSVLFENILHDFNMASGIRNANAFGCRDVYYLGYKRFDRRGCCGVYHYTPVNYVRDFDCLKELLNSHDHVIGLDYVEGKSISMNDFEWKPNTLMIFGSEGYGISPFMQSFCHNIVHINQFGSVPSLNVAVASGIIMNDFVSKVNV